jgi:diguanylate cyclase (GGDEF)-like protein
MEAADLIRRSLQFASVGVQLGNSVLLAIFFATLARSVRLPEVRLWALAWLSDALGLAFVWAASFMGFPHLGLRLALSAYAGAKTAFITFLVSGALYHVQPHKRIRLDPKFLVPAITVWSLALGFLAPELVLVQLAEALLVGSLGLMGGIMVLRHPRTQRSRWLGVAFLVQSLLFLHYVPFLLPKVWGAPVYNPGHLVFSSFFDAGAELLVALASLAALESLATERFRRMNQELMASREHLRLLVDRDPLTGLLNRRSLRQILVEAQERGASLIFLDLDGFKNINDRFGHLMGDECLKRVASSLLKTFRGEDALFRWGGDEFLVVCPGLRPEGARARIGQVAESLLEEIGDLPTCAFSYGISELPPEGDPEAALREADGRMYASRKTPPKS